MSDYISREDALKGQKTGTFANGICFEAKACVPVDYIESLEPADVVQVVHGKWIHDGHHRRCNRCGTYFCNTDREGDTIPNNFCPNCGARMDSEE